MAKACQAAVSARVLLETRDADGACNRAYYAMFDAARASEHPESAVLYRYSLLLSGWIKNYAELMPNSLHNSLQTVLEPGVNRPLAPAQYQKHGQHGAPSEMLEQTCFTQSRRIRISGDCI